MFKIINPLNSLIWLNKLFKILSLTTGDMIFKLTRILQNIVFNFQLKRIKIIVFILKFGVKSTLPNLILYFLHRLNKLRNNFLMYLSLLNKIRRRPLSISNFFHNNCFFIFPIHFLKYIIWSLRRNLFFDFINRDIIFTQISFFQFKNKIKLFIDLWNFIFHIHHKTRSIVIDFKTILNKFIYFIIVFYNHFFEFFLNFLLLFLSLLLFVKLILSFYQKAIIGSVWKFALWLYYFSENFRNVLWSLDNHLRIFHE